MYSRTCRIGLVLVFAAYRFSHNTRLLHESLHTNHRRCRSDPNPVALERGVVGDARSAAKRTLERRHTPIRWIENNRAPRSRATQRDRCAGNSSGAARSDGSLVASACRRCGFERRTKTFQAANRTKFASASTAPQAERGWRHRFVVGSFHEGIHGGAPARLRPSIGRVSAEPARRAGSEPMTNAGSCESEGRMLCVVAHASRGALQARALSA